MVKNLYNNNRTVLTHYNILSFFSHPHGHDLSLCTLDDQSATFSIQWHNGNHANIPTQSVSPFLKFAKQHQLPIHAHPNACLVRTPSGNAAFDTFLQAQQQQMKANQQAYDQAMAEYEHQQSILQAWTAYEQKDANLAGIAIKLNTVAHQAAPLLNGEHRLHIASLEQEQTTHEKKKHALEHKKNASIAQHQTRMTDLYAEKTQLQSEQNSSQMQLAAAFLSDYERYQQQQKTYEQQLRSYRAAFEDYQNWQRQNPAEQARTRAAIQAKEQTLASLNARITPLESSPNPDLNHLRQLKAQRTSLDASLSQLKRHRCFITRSMPVAPIAPKKPIAQCALGKGLTNLSYAAIKLWHTQQTNQYAQRISHINRTIQEEEHRHQETLRNFDASICKHQTAITRCEDKTKRMQDDFYYLTLHIGARTIYSRSHAYDSESYYQALTHAASQHKSLVTSQRVVQSIQQPTEAKPTHAPQQPIPTGNAVIDVSFSHVTLHYNVNDWEKSIAKNNSVFSTRGKKNYLAKALFITLVAVLGCVGLCMAWNALWSFAIIQAYNPEPWIVLLNLTALAIGTAGVFSYTKALQHVANHTRLAFIMQKVTTLLQPDQASVAKKTPTLAPISPVRARETIDATTPKRYPSVDDYAQPITQSGAQHQRLTIAPTSQEPTTARLYPAL